MYSLTCCYQSAKRVTVLEVMERLQIFSVEEVEMWGELVLKTKN